VRRSGHLALLAAIAGLGPKHASVARGTSLNAFELCAAASRAWLWRDQGRRTHSYALLAPVRGWSTEGRYPNPKDARPSLDQLA
jgi:hypothetical protein